MTRRVAPGSEFAGFRFPSEVITLAVRWYLRFGLSYRDVEELLARTRHRGEPRDRTPVGWAVHPVVRRGRPGPAGAPRGPLVRRRDVCEAQRPVALPVGTVSTARQGVRLPPSCEKRNDAKRTESRYETATAPSLHS